MEGRVRLWDVVVGAALALMVAGMCLPWWSMNAADILGGLGLDSELLGISTDFTGWSTPLGGMGIAAVVLNALALEFAGLKFSFPARTPLPAWYKEGWVVAVLGGLCTLFGAIVCAAAPSGGFVAWNWRPGSALVLGGGVAMLVAGIVMSRDRSGSYQARTLFSCSSCGAVINRDASFCPGCGRGVASLRPESGVANRCTHCDAPLVSGAAFCSDCGWRV